MQIFVSAWQSGLTLCTLLSSAQRPFVINGKNNVLTRIMQPSLSIAWFEGDKVNFKIMKACLHVKLKGMNKINKIKSSKIWNNSKTCPGLLPLITFLAWSILLWKTSFAFSRIFAQTCKMCNNDHQWCRVKKMFLWQQNW